MPYLILRRGELDLRVIPIGGERCTFGRSEDCTIQLSDPSISRRQFAVELERDRHRLVNLSESGTVVNGKKKFEPCWLVEGDTLTLGPYTVVFSRSPSGDASDRESRSGGQVQTISGPSAPGVPEGTRLQLNICRPGRGPELRPWDSKPLTIGRAEENQLVIDDSTVSLDHLRLRRMGTQVIVDDLESKNGVHVEGRRVRSAPLLLGETFRLGEVEITLEDADAKPVADELPGVIGRSPPMLELARQVRKIAGTAASVVITGETGTGKSQLARAIHSLSSRAERPFVAIDCAQLEENLVSSELFGHEEGAFSGATEARKGAFEWGQGGTIFIDEIGELPLSLQPKLLRVLQERTVKRLGGNEEIAVDVRVIAATHRDLDAMVAAGTFREDLWYRLCTVELELPALRQRASDIGLLATVILRSLVPAGTTVRLSDDALGTLQAHPFRGNVRELQRVLERALILREGNTIEEGDLHLDDRAPVAAPEPTLEVKSGPLLLQAGSTLDAYMRQIASWTVEVHGGNKSTAADALGITRNYLKALLKK